MAQEERISLNQWCKDTGYNEYLEKLQEFEFETIDDLFILSDDDLSDLCKELGLKFGKKSKFLHAIKTAKKKHDEKDDEKDEEKNNGNPNREIFKDGIHIVPFKKREYQLPDGGKGFAAGNVAVLSTWRDKIYSLAGKQDVEPGTGSHMEESKRAPEKLFCSSKHKIILVCGKTRVGKSTLINSMMNYIYDVQYSDKFRLKLVHERKDKYGDADSCTQHISSYRIKQPKGGNIDYDLTIIDTPGFGNSKGIKKDKQIVEEFKYILDNILTQINGICFVVKAADTRLDASQTYVFNSILNLWAKDISKNIFILMTFADGKKANCIDALNANDILKNVKKRYPINNSAFTDNPLDENFNDGNETMLRKIFWDMGTKCLKTFFDELDNVKPQSTDNSKKVLRQRDQIQAKIDSVSSNLHYILMQEEEVNRQKKFIEKHKMEINAAKKIEYEQNTRVWQRIKVTERMLNCNKARKTCHANCLTPFAYLYCVMSWEGKCEICGYSSGDHIFEYYKWDWVTKKVKRSTWDGNQSLKDSFDQATQDKRRAENRIKKLENKLKQYEEESQNQLAMILSLQNELEKIALRPKFSTFGDYIDQLIEIENQNVSSRNTDKIRYLKSLKEQEKMIEKLSKTKNPNVFLFMRRVN